LPSDREVTQQHALKNRIRTIFASPRLPLQGTSGQVTIGIMEQWNAGIMGSVKMGKWVIVKFLLTEN